VVDAFEQGAGLVLIGLNELFDQAQVKVASGLALYQMQMLVFPVMQLANDLQEFGVQWVICIYICIHRDGS
jgi:hypothetical protein